MSELGRLVQEYRDRQKYPVADARIAAAIGVSRSSVGNWIKGTAVPSPENLRALAAHLEMSYLRVFEAAMTDAGYLPAAGVSREQVALAARAGAPDHAPDTVTGEGSQDDGRFEPA